MLEPITTATVLWGLGGAVVSGIIGNRADEFAVNNWRQFLENARQYHPGENHELQNALCRAYLQATLQICAQRGEKLGMPVGKWLLGSAGKIERLFRSDTPLGYESENERQWIDNVKDGICDRLKNLELPFDYGNNELDDLQKEVELLMQVKETAKREAQLREPLIEKTLKDLEDSYGAVPDGFKCLFEKRWFDYICACFQYQLATNPHIANKFQNRLLAKIAARNASGVVSEATVPEIEIQLQRLGGEMSQQLREVKGLLDKQQRKLDEAQGDIWLPILALEQDTNARVRRVEEVLDSVSAVLEEADLAGMKEVLTKTLELAREILASLKTPVQEVLKVPEDVQSLIDKGEAFRVAGKYEDARATFQKAKELAEPYDERFAVIAVNRKLAHILFEYENNASAAIDILKECLGELKDSKAETQRGMVLYDLGSNEVTRGNFDEAQAYFGEALDIAEKDKDTFGIASIVQQLGWIEYHRGHFKNALDQYDKALKYFLGIYQKHDSKTEKAASDGIAICHHHRGLACENLGNTLDAETSYKNALVWYGRIDRKIALGIVRFLLAHLKVREAEYDESKTYLNEAVDTFKDIGDAKHLAMCFDLRGRTHYALGQIGDAISAFEEALAIVETAKISDDQVELLNKLGRLCLNESNNNSQLEKAKALFHKAKDIAIENGLFEGYAEALQNLARIAQLEKNINERNRLLIEGVETLEELLLKIQSEPRRAFIVGKVGVLYEQMDKFLQALNYFQKAKKSFEAISDVPGIANCLGSIARMYFRLGKRREECETYRQLKQLVDGTPYYDLIAGTAINLGEISVQLGNLDEAKMMFQEAEFLCHKYNLQYAQELAGKIKTLDNLISIRKPPELGFDQLVNELFELIEWFPEAKDSLLRFWITYRVGTILANVRGSLGVKLMLCQDDVTDFLTLSKSLKAYSDLCLQVITTKPNVALLDFAPIPEDREFSFKAATHDSTFQMTSSIARSEITGNEGRVIGFHPFAVPDQAHELLLSSTADDVIKQRIFYLPYPRHSFNDKVFVDLVESKRLGLIPVYFKSLPNSEDVIVLHSAKLNLPILSTDDVERERRQIRKVKRALAQMLSVNEDSAQSALTELVFEVDELFDTFQSNQSIQAQIYVLQFPSVFDKELHIAIVA